MTTNHFTPNYSYHRSRFDAWRHYSHVTPSDPSQISNRTRYGSYDITKRDVDDQKVLYYVPSSYGSDYDLSQLDEKLLHRQRTKYYSPVILKERYYQSSDDDDDANDDEYILSPRRDTYLSPARSQIIERIYYEPAPTVEFIYEEDSKPRQEDVVEYTVRDHVPRKRYVEDIQPIRQTAYVETLPPITRSPRTSPTPRPIQSLQFNESSSPHRSTVKQQSPRMSPIRASPTPRPIQPLQYNESSSPPRSIMKHRSPRISPIRASPTPRPIQPLQYNEPSSTPRSILKQQTPRISPAHEPPSKIIPQNRNKPQRISLKEVLAQNRARRGSRIPKPRREVDEQPLHDLPTYNRNFIKNGYFVHK